MSIFVLALTSAFLQIDVQTKKLFHEWTTSPQIAQVTFGLPNEEELRFVSELLNHTASAFETTEMNSVEFHFLASMVAGIKMEHSSESIQDCAHHLSAIQDELEGIADSRRLRMLLRLFVLRKEHDLAEKVAVALAQNDQTHIEDSLVLALYEIQRSFEKGNIKDAQRLFVSADNHLQECDASYLRAPFAHGYAKLSPSIDEALFGWDRLAKWLLDFDCTQREVDLMYFDWLRRLDRPIQITPNHPNSTIAALAERALQFEEEGMVQHLLYEVNQQIMKKEYQGALLILQKMLKLKGTHQVQVQVLAQLIKERIENKPSQLLNVIAQSHQLGVEVCRELLLSTLSQSADADLYYRAEGYRLLGDRVLAKKLFQEVIEQNGATVQSVAGLADCTRDINSMRQVIYSTRPEGESAYWYWLAQLRILEWFREDGGAQSEVIAKINRLRKKDPSLGGAHFLSQFNLLLF